MLQPVVVEQPVRVTWSNFAGRVGSRFLIELRDNQRIMGLRCPKCSTVYVPPKSVCPRCLDSLDEWVEVSNQGTVVTYTVVNYIYSDLYQPKNVPYAVGIIKLDGANTGICHFIDEVDPSRLKVSSRVQAVFKKKREASILDIDYFKLIP